MLTRRRSAATLSLLLAVALAFLALFFAYGGAPPALAQDSGTTTTIIDGGGGAKGYEPTNVQVVPGNGELTVSWTATSRPGVDDQDISHAVRWSQTNGVWDNPGAPPNDYYDDPGEPIHGIVIDPGVNSYKITGLKNRLVTGVHVRSFARWRRGQGESESSHWVRVKGTDTTPLADEVIFDESGYSVTEGGTVSLGLSRYAILDNSLDAPLAFTLATDDGTAESSDYTAFSSRPVAMAARATTATSSVVTTSDDLVEDDETFTVSISVPDGSLFGAGDPATITIEDEDRASAKVAFGSDAASTTKYTDTVAEAVTGGTLNVPVTVSHLPGASTTFAVEILSGSTATEGSDFSIAAKSVTFGPTTSRTQNVAITLTDDVDYETDETIQLRIVAADYPGNDLGDYYVRDAAGATATVAVTSEDTQLAPKGYAIKPGTVSVTEGGNAGLTLTLGQAAPAGGLAFTVAPAYASGAGKAGAADLSSPPAKVTVAENELTLSFSIPIAADGLVEESETLTVTVTSDDTTWTVDPSRGNTVTITIEDNDRDNAGIAFGTDPASTTKYTDTVAEAVSGGTLNVPVTVSHLPGASTTFAVEVLSGGTATEGSDFSIADKSVTFGPTTAKTQNVAIAITNDSVYEDDETIELRIIAADNPANDLGDHYARVAAGATAAVTISKDESRIAFGTDPLSVRKYTGIVTEAVTGGTFNVPVTVSRLPAASAIFVVEVLPGGTASEGGDFSIAAKSVTFGPTTAKTQNLAITLTDDGDVEDPETIELRITAADNPAKEPGDHYVRDDAGATATIIIVSDDGTTEVIDGGGGANGYEPANVQVVPGDGELTVSWTAASRPGVDDNDIFYAVRWSQTPDGWDNPGSPPNQHSDSPLLPIDGLVMERGATSYTIEGLKNRVATSVYVRSFTHPVQRQASAATSSDWVRVRGPNTTPVANEVIFDETGYSVSEGGTVSLGMTRYGVTGAFLGDSLTLVVDTTDGTAASTDYTGFSARSITMPANAATAASGVATTSDDLVEEDETLTVSISVPDTSIFRVGDPSTATITIEDDDRADARIAFGNNAASTTKYSATVAEAVTGGTLNVPVTVSHLPGAPTTFEVELLSGGTATEDSDFSIAAKSVTFGPTDSSKTKNVAITLIDDADYENNETIELRIVAADSAVDDLGDHYDRDASGATATITVTSADARSATKIYSIPSAVSATEGGNAELTLTLGEAAPSGGLEFNVSATYPGAAHGQALPSDTNNFRSATHTVAAGHSSSTISIPIAADGLVEKSETFTVTVATDDYRWSVDPDGGNTATVTMNDGTRGARIAFGTHPRSTTKYIATVAENSPDGYLEVPLSVSHSASGEITFKVEALTTGTATPDADYRLYSAGVEFIPHGTRTKKLRITLSDDSTYEEDETIELRIVAADDPVNDLGDLYARHASGATATITITSDESHWVTASEDELTVEERDTATYTVVLTDEPTADVTVTPVSSGDGATVSGPVTFTRLDWSVPQEITVTAGTEHFATISHRVSSDDTNFTSDKTESVNVTVSAATIQTPPETPPETPKTDPTKFYGITSAVTTAEGNNAELTVTLSEAAPADMTFNVSYQYGISSAIAADTGAGRPTTVTVASGNTTATLSIPIARDSKVESDENLKLSITPGQGVTAEWGPSADSADSASVTIQDTTITVSLGQATYTVGEGDGSVYVGINFSSAIPEGVQPQFRIVLDDSTATYKEDFDLDLREENIARGSTTYSYRVSIVDDHIQESDETITLSLRNISPPAGYAIVSPRRTVITVTDNDTAGVRVRVSESARSVMESATTTYTVNLRSEPTSDVTITPTSDDTDKATVSGAVTFTPAGWHWPKTITITGVKEGTATISHQASSTDTNYTSSLSIDSVAVTVTSSKVYEISSTAAASEGGNAELTVTLHEDAPAGGLEFTVTPTYESGTGKAVAADLSSPPATVTVAENQRTATLTIPIARDALVEGSETFTVAIATSATGWSKTADGADTATVTITDLTREVSLAASTYTVGESDGNVTVGLAVSGLHADTITATVTFYGRDRDPGRGLRRKHHRHHRPGVLRSGCDFRDAGRGHQDRRVGRGTRDLHRNHHLGLHRSRHP